jgi:GNAT superfamily N-acetyltransferase
MSAELPFSIRAAGARDAKASRMLLPTFADSMGFGLVAEAGLPPRVVATAGLTRSVRPTPLVGPGIEVHVIKPFRRRGIGRSLVGYLAAHASANRAHALYAAHKVPLGGEEFHAWQALGFSVCETVVDHDLPLDEFELQLAPLYERMQRRGKIPASARIIPLFEADASKVVRLHLSELGGDSATLLRRLRGEAPESFAPRHSRVLLLDGRVVGFILGHRIAHDVVHVDANVLAPEIRGGWPNVWLKLEATRSAREWGIQKFVFSTFDHYTDTRSFTEKLHGVNVRTTVLMYLPLEPIA